MGTLNAPKPKKILAPEGQFPAMLYRIVDLGTKMDSFQGSTPEPKHTIHCTWELLGTAMEDGRPFSISKEFTVTQSGFDANSFYFAKTSNINKLLQKWTGKDEKACSKPYVLADLLRDNVPCTVSVEHVESRKEKGVFYDVLESVKPYKGKEKLVPVNPRTIVDLDEASDGLPEWMVKRRQEALEFSEGGVPERTHRADGPDANPGDEFDTF